MALARIFIPQKGTAAQDSPLNVVGYGRQAFRERPEAETDGHAIQGFSSRVLAPYSGHTRDKKSQKEKDGLPLRGLGQV